MKYKIELNCIGSTRFLNYWDSIGANDVICEIVGGQLLLVPSGNDPKKMITFQEFLTLVETSNGTLKNG